MASQRFYRIVGKGRSSGEALESLTGRFHDDQSQPTSYVAPSIMTAWKEVSANFGSARANPAAFRGFVIEVSDANILDLREDVRVAALMVDPAPVQCKLLAEELRESGVDGLRYPSMRSPGDECVVLFLENVRHRVSMDPVPGDEWKDFVDSMG